jgi:hypothetical protein
VTSTAWYDIIDISPHSFLTTILLLPNPHPFLTYPAFNLFNHQDKAKAELHGLLEESELEFACLLVVANKQDMATALKPDVVAQRLEVEKLAPRLAKVLLHFFFSSSASSFFFFRCLSFRAYLFLLFQVMPAVALTGDGLQEALEWLHENMKPI